MADGAGGRAAAPLANAAARQPVSAAPRLRQPAGTQLVPPEGFTGEPRKPPVSKSEQSGSPGAQHDEQAGSNMHGAAEAQHSSIASGASRASRPSARKSLFSTPQPALSGQRPGSPEPARMQHPTPQVAPTPTYISRSQQQESGLSAGVVDSHRAAVQASPAVSEMVYELRPATARTGRFPAHLEDEREGYASSSGSHQQPGSAGPDSHRARDWAADTGMPLSPAEPDDAAWQQDRGYTAGASVGQVGSAEGAGSSLPDYSGFSSEMRAAAQATAAALLAESTRQGDSAWHQAEQSTGRQISPAGGRSSGSSGQIRADWGAASAGLGADQFQYGDRQDSQEGYLMTLDELEQQIAALNMTLGDEEGMGPEGEPDFTVHQSRSALPERRKSQQNLGGWLCMSPTK